MNDASVFDARFKFPSSFIIHGGSMCGKSHFLKLLLRNWTRLFTQDVHYIYMFYGEYNDGLKELQKEHNSKLKLIPGLPENLDDYIIKQQAGCLIFDDLGHEAFASKAITNLFIKQVHHQNVCAIMTTQDIFASGKERLTILRNAHYLVLFKSPLDKSLVYYLARRILPHKASTFINIYERCTERKWGYLLVEGHPEVENQQAKFRSDIFGAIQKCFIPL